jgi:hypothetical protein
MFYTKKINLLFELKAIILFKIILKFLLANIIIIAALFG